MMGLQGVTLRRGTKVILQDAQVMVQPGEKVGLVGRNGAGKSSLFALWAGRLSADRGEVLFPSHWRVAEVSQHMPETTQSATDFVLEGDGVLQAALQALQEAEARDDGNAMAEAHAALAHAGAFDARSRAQSLLLGLGFEVADLDDPVRDFSGGWRMRLQLARALMSPAELLLLDEPTNHLDLDALVWLESWLKRHSGTLVVISHDREFLDSVTRVTLHLEDAQITRYGVNYTGFESLRAQRMAQATAAYAKQQERIAHLQRFIDRFRAKATKARQAQSRVKALERMERLAPVLTAGSFQFDFREPQSLPNPMLVLRDLNCGYGDQVVVRGVTRTVLPGQRIGILGANGQGKSTVVKTWVGQLPPIGGAMTAGKGLTVGYFAQQEMDLLQEDDTPLQRMVRLARQVSPQAREQDIRNFLGQFHFEGDMVHQRIGTLSGGERARLVLATIVWQRPNLLLLDEPTNHLDLNTREALSMALNSFEGTVLLVSHDRALLREVCDEFWLVSQGQLSPFDGDLDDYQRALLDRKPTASAQPGAYAPPVAAPAPSPRNAPSTPPPASGGRDDRKARAQERQRQADLTRPVRVELTQIDKRLALLAQEQDQTQARLATVDLSVSERADLGRQLHHIAAETAMLEERWLSLQDQLEKLQQGLSA